MSLEFFINIINFLLYTLANNHFYNGQNKTLLPVMTTNKSVYLFSVKKML